MPSLWNRRTKNVEIIDDISLKALLLAAEHRSSMELFRTKIYATKGSCSRLVIKCGNIGKFYEVSQKLL